MTKIIVVLINFVRKKPIIGGIVLAAIIGLVAAGAQINPEYTPDEESNPIEVEIWSLRIAGPEFNEINIHRGNITLQSQSLYKLGFVPMGDSPENLLIQVLKKNPDNQFGATSGVVYSEEFYLERTLVDTGMSKYYTWDYLGDDRFSVSDRECFLDDTKCEYLIIVKRFGNLEGSLSVSLSEIIRTV